MKFIALVFCKIFGFKLETYWAYRITTNGMTVMCQHPKPNFDAKTHKFMGRKLILSQK